MQFSISSSTSHPPSLSSTHLDGSLDPRRSLQGPHLTLEDGRTDWRGDTGGDGRGGDVMVQAGTVALSGGVQISSRSGIEETGVSRILPLFALPIVDGSFGEALLCEHCGTLLPQRGILGRGVDQLGERCNGVIPDTGSGIEAG